MNTTEDDYSDASSSSVDEFDQDLNDRRGPRDSRDDFSAPTNRQTGRTLAASGASGAMLPEDDTDTESDDSAANTDDLDTTTNTDLNESGAVVQNRPYDEAVELDDGSDDESIPSHPSPSNQGSTNGSSGGKLSAAPGGNQSLNVGNVNSALNMSGVSAGNSMGSMLGADDDEDASDDDDSDEQVNISDEDDGSDDEDDDDTPAIPEYHPEDYAHLNVSREIKQLFSMISSYKPHSIELDTKLKPFIPDYIPAVGDLDPFLKVPRPDGKPDNLGLKILDEPKAEQSDPTVIKMILAKSSTHLNAPLVKVPSIQQKDASFPLQIQKWVDNIERLHKTNPAPTVTYKKAMPDIESLMQPWPPQYEEILSGVELPSAEIDLSTEDYAKVICALLDIPVQENPIESLHALFSLYLAFKANNHFSRQYGLGQ
mmetsp:Transcript_1188/g.4084  ORF Transcript_1188/g.4084 Transcript_1188/m.4084 type:complete len:427 (-) Transcript_1188:2794-4074(-)|eukprot:CAMPEP_0117445864 /NCGR_PEP_ID=MMETSP0759-20121206/6028_1 /TAXON_ID=63605 /ORGANISM="Percolomonas cosmopolitus, Strain WS" /LENGTH=426 /DNA_ID=CAMNT_0005238079 /DNA_START=203 /DNA_END=1483 /DNA_ORIENTATION=-